MELIYGENEEHIPIEIDEETIEHLKRYVVDVLKKMQQADTEYAHCWTRCGIRFKELQPIFLWGSFKGKHPIEIEIPLIEGGACHEIDLVLY